MTKIKAESEVNGPVFLVGCPRSGTTLLQRMLDAHAEVAIAPETHFIRRFWFQRDHYGDLRGDHAFARLLEDVTAIPEFADMDLDADEFRSRAARAQRTYAAVFWLVLDQFARSRGARLVGEKTPNHLLYMPTLQRFFPTARFVHIVRDPRAVANSWRHVPWSTGTLAGDAGVWLRYLETARECAPATGTITTVHYEALVLDAEATLRSLCGFLQLEFDAAMLAHEGAGPQTIDVEREPWKVGATRQLNRAPLDRWHEELRPEQVQQIEMIAWPEMRRAGYRAQTTWKRLAPLATLSRLQRSHRRLRRRLSLWLR